MYNIKSMKIEKEKEKRIQRSVRMKREINKKVRWLVKRGGYSHFSELVRDLIRKEYDR